MWRSPNGTIRNILGGVVFREPIIMSNVPRLVPGWTKPIIIGRHAHGDQYKATDFVVPGPGQGHHHLHSRRRRRPMEFEVAKFPGGGVAMGMYNFDDSIRDFARASFRYGLDRGYPVYLSTKNTDPQGVRRAGSRTCSPRSSRPSSPTSSPRPGITYEHRLIDDMVAAGAQVGGRLRLGLQELRRRRAVRHRRAGLRLARPDDLGADDARTARRSRRRRRTAPSPGTTGSGRRARRPSTNPIASIFAWTRGLAHRGKVDGTPAVTQFAEALEQVCVETVESGQMTKDLALLIAGTHRG
jgi:isocitrate dehydrogenase